MLVEQAAECGVVSTNILNNSAKDTYHVHESYAGL